MACRVGTGVNDEERKEISDKLEPLFIEASQKRSNHPKCYKVTGHLKERPDVWISDPFQSVVLEVGFFLQPVFACTLDSSAITLCRVVQLSSHMRMSFAYTRFQTSDTNIYGLLAQIGTTTRQTLQMQTKPTANIVRTKFFAGIHSGQQAGMARLGKMSQTLHLPLQLDEKGLTATNLSAGAGRCSPDNKLSVCYTAESKISQVSGCHGHVKPKLQFESDRLKYCLEEKCLH